MLSAAGITPHVSSMVKLNRLLILTVVLFVCCACMNCRATDVDQLSEYQLIDNYDPSVFFAYDPNFVERAAPRLGRASPRLGRASPRLGRASPRLGRASPRLGRGAVGLLLSRLNHAGRYYNPDEDASNDYQYDNDSLMQEKRAAPRLGRAI